MNQNNLAVHLTIEMRKASKAIQKKLKRLSKST